MSKTKFAALSAILTIGAAAYPAHAMDTTIDDGQTETTTQVLNGAGDTLTVEAGGTVATGTAVAVKLQNTNQVVTNLGTILTTSEHGIHVVSGAEYAQIFNSGILTFGGTDRYGVYSEAAHTSFHNTGKVLVLDDCTYGVMAARDYFTFTNDGTISVQAGTASHGFYTNANNAIVINNGLMVSEGTHSEVINIWGGLDAR